MREVKLLDVGGNVKKINMAYKMKGCSLLKKKSPVKRKLTASCKAAARRKFDVYPSAYANMWASKQQGKGKC